MKTVILLLSFSLASCCTTKLVYVPCKPYSFQYTTPTQEIAVRVHPDDLNVLKAYNMEQDKKLEFHNQQIRDYFKSCPKIQ